MVQKERRERDVGEMSEAGKNLAKDT